MGGYVAQEVIKSITNKFKPTQQFFHTDAIEVLPEIDTLNQESISKLEKSSEVSDRYKSLRIVIGDDLLEKVRNSKLFMVGCGAIGCELLKNFAMIGVGTGKDG